MGSYYLYLTCVNWNTHTSVQTLSMGLTDQFSCFCRNSRQGTSHVHHRCQSSIRYDRTGRHCLQKIRTRWPSGGNWDKERAKWNARFHRELTEPKRVGDHLKTTPNIVEASDMINTSKRQWHWPWKPSVAPDKGQADRQYLRPGQRLLPPHVIWSLVLGVKGYGLPPESRPHSHSEVGRT